MSRIGLEPFEAAHLDRFDPGPFDTIVLQAPYADILRTHWPGHAIAAVRGGRTLGIAGAVILGGCAHPWMALSKEMRRNFPVLLTRLTRRALRYLIEVDGVEEVIVTVAPEFAASRRWLQRLGFQQTDNHQVGLVSMSAEGFLFAAKVATQAVSLAQQTRAESKAARYQADAARQQAAYQRSLAEADAVRLRRQTDRLLGRQTAAFAAAGLDPGSGSALLAQQSLAGEAELEALEIRNGGLMRAAALDHSANLMLQRARAANQQRFAAFGSRLLLDSLGKGNLS